MRVLMMTSPEPKVNNSGFSLTEKRFPLGIGFLLTILKKAGHEVTFIDQYLKRDFSFDPNDFDFIGIYANTPCYVGFMDLLEYTKRKRNGRMTKIAVGGPHASVFPGMIPSEVDYIVQGEGEDVICDMVEGRIKERIIKTPRIKDLDAIELPDYESFISQPYMTSVSWFPGKVFNMNTSRGCPFSCSFCSVKKIWGRTYTHMSAHKVIKDIECLINKYSIDGVYFREDNFTLNRDRVLGISEGIGHLGLKWACLRKDTLIRTENGFCEIQKIKMGDKVLSYSEKDNLFEYKQVTKLIRIPNKNKVYKLKFVYLPSITITGDHPYYIIEGKESMRKYRKSGSSYKILESASACFMKVSSLFKKFNLNMKLKSRWSKKMFFTMIPISNRETDIPELNENRCKLLGYFMAEGDLSTKRNVNGEIKYYHVRFSLHHKEIQFAEEIMKLAKREFQANSSNKSNIDKGINSRYVRVNSVKMANFIQRYCINNHSQEKHFVQSIMYLPKWKQKIIIESMWRGDGCVCREKRSINLDIIRTYTTASKKLALQVQAILLRLGQISTFCQNFQGKDSFSNGIIYRISIYNRKKSMAILKDDILYPRLRSIKEIELNETVFNIEVEKNNNYVTESGLVHNCESRVDSLDREMVRIMAESGCGALYIGFESGSQRILDIFNKKTTVEQGLSVGEWCQEFGVRIAGSFITKHPDETEEDRRLTREFIDRIKLTSCWENPFRKDG